MTDLLIRAAHLSAAYWLTLTGLCVLSGALFLLALARWGEVP